METKSDTSPLAGERIEHATYFEVLFPKVRLKPWFWATLGATSAALCLGAYSLGETPALLGTFSVLGLGIGFVPITMAGSYRILISWTRYAPTFLVPTEQDDMDAPSWTTTQLRAFAASHSPWVFAILFCGLACYSFWKGGAFSGLIGPGIVVLATTVLVLSSLVCGIGLAGLFYFGRFVWHLGKRFRVTVNDQRYGILSTGRALLRCYCLTALVWAVYATSSTWSVTGHWIPQVLLALPTFAFFVISFVVCQVPLHNRMVEHKQQRLAELEILLKKLEPHETSDLSETRLRQYEFCLAEIKRVTRWPEWPFSLGSLSGVFGAAFAAVTPQVLPLIVPWILS